LVLIFAKTYQLIIYLKFSFTFYSQYTKLNIRILFTLKLTLDGASPDSSNYAYLFEQVQISSMLSKIFIQSANNGTTTALLTS